VSAEVQTVLFENDLESWGWVWLVVGVVLILAGFAVISGAQWARWVGIVAASLATIAYLPWIYYQPLWTILSVTLAVLVIYALATYGGPREPRTPASA
jgi:membrane protein implicated in regulation of membrane protease activity